MTPRPLLDRAIRLLWALVLVTLPVTSFNYFPFFGRDTLVRPLSLYPLALLLPLLLYRAFRRKRSLSNPALAVLALFAACALLATAVGALLAPPELYGQNYAGRALRAWLTLIIGLAFFLAALWSSRAGEDLRFSLTWLYVGLGLNFLWGLVQIGALYLDIPPKSVVDAWQEVFSIRGMVKGQRISGLSFEPSWLAGQIQTLYMPWIAAALLKGWRVSRWRWLEPLLFGMASILLLLTYSRSGVLMTAGILVVVFVFTSRDLLARGWQMLTAWQAAASRTVRAVRYALLLAGVMAVLVLLGRVMSENKYFAQLWRADSESLLDYAIDIYAGPRLAYAWSAWEVYQAHPLTGVGLGASGFYLHANFPPWSLGQVSEISRLMSPDSRIFPNPKNLYMRLLAETGIPGLAAWLAFYALALGAAAESLRSRRPDLHFVGTAGLFAWLGIVAYNVTQDSLAMPNLWLSLGILLGVAFPAADPTSSSDL